MAGIFQAAIFLAAFTLFLVQPLIGRWLLPAFGGAPSVWSTCLVFFQVALFAGYLWAHLTSRVMSLRAQGWAHGSFIGLALAALWMWPLEVPTPPAALPYPQLWVLAWLLRTVGPAFVTLAATAPLLQRWWLARTQQAPYKLYALSNAGSLLALVCYPLLIEPLLDLPFQAQLWRAAFAGFAALVFGAGALSLGNQDSGSHVAGPPVQWPLRGLWLSLAAVPTLLLVAVTNHITLDVASGPLLWMFPLLVYLISFVLVFGSLETRGRAAFAALWVLCVLALGVNLLLAGKTGLLRQIVVACALLFSACMLCHGELVRFRPPAASLTSFYLWISGGGALGGFLGAVVAPLVFKGFFELQLGVLFVFALLFVSGRQASPEGKQTSPLPRVLFLGVGAGVPLMVASIWLGSVSSFGDAKVLGRWRGFFGAVQVTRFPQITALTHGRIRHGMQWNDPVRQQEPTMYFGLTTGVGRVLTKLKPEQARRIGVLGLGVGTLAAYAHPGDVFLFLEINPHVAEAAREQFSFLKRAAGRVEVNVGDGRSLLAHQAAASLDALVLDAFSSDAVPTHLLTLEAFAVYDSVLKPDGVVIANVSNRHLAVERVVAGAAESRGWSYVVVETPSDAARGSTLVTWLIAARADTLRALRLAGQQPLRGDPVRWTDARSSVFSILR